MLLVAQITHHFLLTFVAEQRPMPEAMNRTREMAQPLPFSLFTNRASFPFE